jgi:hypothetical protein
VLSQRRPAQRHPPTPSDDEVALTESIIDLARRRSVEGGLPMHAGLLPSLHVSHISTASEKPFRFTPVRFRSDLSPLDLRRPHRYRVRVLGDALAERGILPGEILMADTATTHGRVAIVWKATIASAGWRGSAASGDRQWAGLQWHRDAGSEGHWAIVWPPNKLRLFMKRSKPWLREAEVMPRGHHPTASGCCSSHRHDLPSLTTR